MDRVVRERVCVLVFAIVSLTSGVAANAQAAWQPEGQAAVKVSRAALAEAYLRFERAFFASTPTGEQLRDANRAFDRASLSFFTGGYGEAVRVLNQWRRGLAPSKATADEELLDDLVCRVSNRVCTAAILQEVEIRRMSGSEDANTIRPEWKRIAVLVRPAGETGKASERNLGTLLPTDDFLDENRWTIVYDQDGEEKQYEVFGRTDIGVERVLGRYVVVKETMASARADHAERLIRARRAHPELSRGIAMCLARSELLTDTPSSNESAEFLLNPVTLKADVEREIDSLLDGEDPYRRRVGDYWSVLGLGEQGEGDGIPARVYAPAAAKTAVKMPLVIALHGAGGDEHMFMEGYGCGVIRRLADQHEFIVASPRNGPFSGNGEYFDRIVESMTWLYPIDERRIYVIGHSMGGGVATALSKLRADRIAGACCIAGFGGAKKGTKFAPTLVIAAELDALMPIERTRAAGRAAEQAGVGVEFREIEGYGHTLVVGAVLPSAVEWLMRKRLGSENSDGKGK